jgi:predicted nucleic acid-binding protein
MLNDIDPAEIDRKEEELWSEIYNKMVAGGEPKDIAREMADRTAVAFRIAVTTYDRKRYKKHSTLIN